MAKRPACGQVGTNSVCTESMANPASPKFLQNSSQPTFSCHPPKHPRSWVSCPRMTLEPMASAKIPGNAVAAHAENGNQSPTATAAPAASS